MLKTLFFYSFLLNLCYRNEKYIYQNFIDLLNINIYILIVIIKHSLIKKTVKKKKKRMLF